jgi:hypothetical protein
MKKEEIWDIYIKKNPKFVEEGAVIKFTKIGIYQFFERTWDLAHSEGVENGKALESMNNTPEKPKYDSNVYNDVFGSIFGKK